MKKKLLLISKTFEFTTSENLPGEESPLTFCITLDTRSKSYSVSCYIFDNYQTAPIINTTEGQYSIADNLSEFNSFEKLEFFLKNLQIVMELAKEELRYMGISTTGQQLERIESVGPETPFGFYALQFQELSITKLSEWLTTSKYLTTSQLSILKEFVFSMIKQEKDLDKVDASLYTVSEFCEMINRKDMKAGLTFNVYAKMMELFLYHDIKLKAE